MATRNAVGKKNRHLGSNFDDFIEEEGSLAEVDAVAVKRVIAFQIKAMMKKKTPV